MSDELERLDGNGVPEGPDEAAPVLGSRWGKAHHVLLGFLALGLVVWLLSGFYKVDVNEVAIVERLGELVMGEPDGNGVRHAELQPPGQHYALPWPVDVVYKVPTNQSLDLQMEEFNQGTNPQVAELKRAYLRTGAFSKDLLDALFDPYLITADKNILNGKMSIRYRVKNPEAFLMSVSHGSGSGRTEIVEQVGVHLKEVAKHVLVREIGKTPVDELLFGDKQKVWRRLAAGIREEAERQNLGLDVDSVTLETRWPAQVDEAFRNVTNKMFFKETMRKEAEAYATRVKQNAEVGDAARILAVAEAYKKKITSEAINEALKFDAVYKQYKDSPELTKVSLYADALRAVQINVMRTILVRPGQKATVVIDPPSEERALRGGASGTNGAAGGGGPGGG